MEVIGISPQAVYQLNGQMTFHTPGIWFSVHGENDSLVKKKNSKIEDMKATLNLWKMRHLSLIGRILILKTLAIPKIIYQATV